jgi:hypothetical protein
MRKLALVSVQMSSTGALYFLMCNYPLTIDSAIEYVHSAGEFSLSTGSIYSRSALNVMRNAAKQRS